MPPLNGVSTDKTVAGVTGNNTAEPQGGAGVFGTSQDGEGVHGETNSTTFAAVAGIELNPSSNIAAVFGEQRGGGPAIFGTAKGNGAGVFGSSQGGEGVHGETNSTTFAAVAGVELNPSSNIAAVFGEQRGGGPAIFGTAKGNGAGVFGTSQNGEGVHGETNSTAFAAVAGIELNPSSNIAAVFGEQRGGGPAIFGTAKGNGAGVFGTSQGGEGVHGETNSTTFAAVAGITLNASGTGAGIFGESRGQGPAGFFKGNVVVTGSITHGGTGFFSGDVEVAGDIKLTGGDCAEDFDIAGADCAEPGTIMVLGDAGILEPSAMAYDKRVVGVISGAGHYKPGIVLDKQGAKPDRKPIALVGKVYCKVDAQYGAVETGDLLTTSPTPGYAMKASDQVKGFGAVIGKALRPLTAGQGLIPIVVALQ